MDWNIDSFSILFIYFQLYQHLQLVRREPVRWEVRTCTFTLVSISETLSFWYGVLLLLQHALFHLFMEISEA